MDSHRLLREISECSNCQIGQEEADAVDDDSDNVPFRDDDDDNKGDEDVNEGAPEDETSDEASDTVLGDDEELGEVIRNFGFAGNPIICHIRQYVIIITNDSRNEIFKINQ